MIRRKIGETSEKPKEKESIGMIKNQRNIMDCSSNEEDIDFRSRIF
jgi:hypothetical protein